MVSDAAASIVVGALGAAAAILTVVIGQWRTNVSNVRLGAWEPLFKRKTKLFNQLGVQTNQFYRAYLRGYGLEQVCKLIESKDDANVESGIATMLYILDETFQPLADHPNTTALHKQFLQFDEVKDDSAARAVWAAEVRGRIMNLYSRLLSLIHTRTEPLVTELTMLAHDEDMIRYVHHLMADRVNQAIGAGHSLESINFDDEQRNLLAEIAPIKSALRADLVLSSRGWRHLFEGPKDSKYAAWAEKAKVTPDVVADHPAYPPFAPPSLPGSGMQQREEQRIRKQMGKP